MRGRKSLWDADHLLPVAEGGGECDLSNLRTLCLKCHRARTAELRQRLRAKC
jgi:5-methylcytosine-specific restriction endonuclease McrA